MIDQHDPEWEVDGTWKEFSNGTHSVFCKLDRARNLMKIVLSNGTHAAVPFSDFGEFIMITDAPCPECGLQVKLDFGFLPSLRIICGSCRRAYILKGGKFIPSDDETGALVS
jgi:hypothetical protein